MTSTKPRRTIFDTLKKGAPGRLGLADAAKLAGKISAFPGHVPVEMRQPSDQVSGHALDQESDHRSDQLPDHGLDRLSGHDPTPVPTPVGTTDPTPAPTNDPTSIFNPTPEPTPDPTIKKMVRGLPKNKRRFLHFIIDHEPTEDDYIVSRREVAERLNMTEISVKRYFEEFARQGFFRKETYRSGICQGLQIFLIRSRCQQFKAIDPTHEPTSDPTTANDPTHEPTSDPTPYKEDRKIENLSISQNRVEATWATLAAAGFGADQVKQIVRALVELGKPIDRLIQSLDHAEWELTNGGMRDKDGQPVVDPCSWVFRALSRTGYYRRPKGYVSPEEQMALDAEAEAKAVQAARQKAEQARFEAWKGGLSAAELAAAMHGHPGGPKDAWLRRVWKERQASKDNGVERKA